MSGLSFVAFDTETTGLDLVEDRLLDVGAVRFAPGRVECTYESLVWPGRSIPAISMSIHHITEAMVADAPRPREVLAELSRVLDGAVMLAHNAPFDMAVLTLELARQQLPVPDVWVLDTCVLAEALMTEKPTLKLGVLMEQLGSTDTNDHRALPDARCVVTLFEHIVTRVKSGQPTWADLLDLHGPAFSLKEFSALSIADQWHLAVVVNAVEERRPVTIVLKSAPGRESQISPRGFGMQDGRWTIVVENPRPEPIYMDTIASMAKVMPPQSNVRTPAR